MFLEFFNVLRLHGLNISLDEWLVLIDALNRGMAENSLMEFYYLCRNVLIKSETEYDKFDIFEIPTTAFGKGNYPSTTAWVCRNSTP